MGKNIFSLLLIFSIIICISGTVYAEGEIPCYWEGTVKVNGNDINGSLLIPYDNKTMTVIEGYDNPVYGATNLPLGYYYLGVDDESDYVFFKFENLVADQSPVQWISGNFYSDFNLFSHTFVTYPLEMNISYYLFITSFIS